MPMMPKRGVKKFHSSLLRLWPARDVLVMGPRYRVASFDSQLTVTLVDEGI